MNTPDGPENKAYAAATAISEQVGKLWMQAHSEGVRNGLEVAAVLLDQAATNARAQSFAEGVGEWVVGLIEGLRDQVRLVSLQVPDPEGT